MAHFNLLRYPTLVRQERLRQRLWGFGGGMLGSWVLAWVGLQWLAMDTDTLRHDLSHLQKQAAEQKRQMLFAQNLAEQQQSWVRQRALLAQVQAQQQALLSLHAGLQDEAVRSGLRLQRLQIDADRLEVQAQAPLAKSMTAAGQRLSERVGQTLMLTSLSEVMPYHDATRSQTVAFSWQGTWPRLGGTLSKDASP